MNHLCSTLLVTSFCSLAIAGVPKIEFEQTVYDFGKISEAESVSGAFKFKNAGDGILKLEKPMTTCGCTVTALKTDTLKPGETGEVPFTLVLRGLKGTLWKSIKVPSNDPAKPTSLLTIKAHYTPLYDVSPLVLRADVVKDGPARDLSITVTRSDGKPARIQRIETSTPSITATIDPESNPNAPTARIRVRVPGGDKPRYMNGFVSIYAGENAATPVAKVYVSANIVGEFSVSPQQLFWSITDPAKARRELPEVLVTRRVTIRSTNGKPFELKNPQSSIPSVSLELNELADGTGYEMVARLTDIPTQSVNGSITFDTSSESQPRIDMPVTIRLVQLNPRRIALPRPPIRAADAARIAAPQRSGSTAAPVSDPTTAVP